MPSKVGIINNALRLLGEPKIAALTSTQPYAVKLVDAYVDEVRSWFEDHDWAFATNEVQLTQVTPAVAGWSYTFNLPANMSRILRVANSTRPEVPGIRYESRAGQILTDSEVTFLRYIDGSFIDSEGGWPQKFADALAARLAEAVYPSTDETNSTRDRIEKTRRRRVKDAKAFDAQSKPLGYPPTGRYITTRSLGISGNYRGRS